MASIINNICNNNRNNCINNNKIWALNPNFKALKNIIFQDIKLRWIFPISNVHYIWNEFLLINLFLSFYINLLNVVRYFCLSYLHIKSIHLCWILGFNLHSKRGISLQPLYHKQNTFLSLIYGLILIIIDNFLKFLVWILKFVALFD